MHPMRSLAILAMVLGLTATAQADPNPQLAQSVSLRLERYGIAVDPARLTTAQAAALHLLMVSDKSYLEVRRKAGAILRDPDFAD